MITPRQTRLIRVGDLHAFRRALVGLGCAVPEGALPDSAVIVPTRAAGLVLADTFAVRQPHRPPPLLVTRDQVYDEFAGRLPLVPRRLTVFERDAIFHAAAVHAAAGHALPFALRPGLVAEMLRFYDQVRRQSQAVDRFETLIIEALGGGEAQDRGAERLLQQTHFLAQAFREYESRVAGSGACDEHTLRARVLAEPAVRPLRHLIVSVPDWIADPGGLFLADFELFARMPDLETVDIVATLATLGSGFHQRLHDWWPGLEEVDGETLSAPSTPARPVLVRPPVDASDRLWFTYRDREEELVAIARRVRTDPDAAAPDRTAVVFKRPLPYLYLAPDTLGAANLPVRAFDTLPLAAEPPVAVIDLVLDAVETDFSRASLVALLRCPQLGHWPVSPPLSPEAIAGLNRALSDERYLGGVARLETLVERWRDTRSGAAAAAALVCARLLGPLRDTRPAGDHLDCVAAFLAQHQTHLEPDHELADREQRAQSAIASLLQELGAASRAHHNPDWTADDLGAALRRWIGEGTFAARQPASGISLIDDQAARYGDFDDLTIVGLTEHDWPERPRRNIFYPPRLLRALNWPSEKDRQAAADARFIDLLSSARRHTELSTFTLDDESLVSRSVQLDEIPRARLSTITRTQADAGIFLEEVLTADPPPPATFDAASAAWIALRTSRLPLDAPEFHGTTAARAPAPWSVSALETYLGCPFKFFAQHILKLDEEPDDDEVMDPRRQGQFVHAVFEAFFSEWQAAGFRAITPANLDEARERFRAVVDRLIEALPEGEAGLERTRLLGSSAATGLGDAVLRMEAERPTPVVERLLEHSLTGRFAISTSEGPRDVELRGKADRVDLLADGTFRLIDYKLGWPPDRGRALQLPIYAVCAEQRLEGHRGRAWTLGEAMYLAFKGPKRVVPLFASEAARAETLAKAQQRLAETLDAINRGAFPPSPDDVFRCETCSFQAVCRKDYVGNL